MDRPPHNWRPPWTFIPEESGRMERDDFVSEWKPNEKLNGWRKKTAPVCAVFLFFSKTFFCWQSWKTVRKTSRRKETNIIKLRWRATLTMTKELEAPTTGPTHQREGGSSGCDSKLTCLKLNQLLRNQRAGTSRQRRYMNMCHRRSEGGRTDGRKLGTGRRNEGHLRAEMKDALENRLIRPHIHVSNDDIRHNKTLR
jgi:hypothetical protein